MKPTTFLVSALAAAAASAAPTSTSTCKRASVDLAAFNQFAFQNQDLQYFNAINGLDLNGLVQLSVSNGLDLGVFQSVFVQDVVDVNALLQLQQVALLAQLGGLGLLGGVDLTAVQIDVLNLGLLGDAIGGFDLSSLVDQALVPQLQTVIQQTDITAVVLKK
ncbi:hypothetical protein SLS62_002685 [Diatrype stigma]|uniref:Uncharacterized protein n=1 Tax=Diatrype stigma TaxID=117547 RepID=A0AAN9YV97_9PEZI